MREEFRVMPHSTQEVVTGVAPKLRQDTKLESEGAEFLVLGMLLIEGIHCFKAYTNFAGYDLIAVNPASQKQARIQVKSRWATNYNRRFPIKNFNCDFVVHAALNRGFSWKKGDPLAGKKSPQFYCFPVEVVKAAKIVNSSWGMVSINSIPNLSGYENAWDLIRDFLNCKRREFKLANSISK
jgi:hypothetical protein